MTAVAAWPGCAPHQHGGSHHHRRTGSVDSVASEDWYDAYDEFLENLEQYPDMDTCNAAHQSAGLAGLTGPADPERETKLLPDRGDGWSVERRRAAIDAMRKIVLADPLTDDPNCVKHECRSNMTLERFLRARDYNPKVAAALYLEHRRWRQSFRWSVSPASIPNQLAAEKLCLQGVAKNGQPFVCLLARRHTGSARDMEEVKRFFVYTMDTIIQGLGPGGKFLIMVDLGGLSNKNTDLKTAAVAFEILQKYYVERMGALWLVNPLTLFWAMWKFLSPLIAPATREKIHFIRGKEISDLLAHCDAGVIPSEYGGTAPLRPISAGPAPWEPPGKRRLWKY